MQPEGWVTENDLKAGNTANPWLGCMPRGWLDSCPWGDSYDGADLPRHWDTGVHILGKLSALAVRSFFQMVWREATALWGESQPSAVKADMGPSTADHVGTEGGEGDAFGHHPIEMLSDLQRKLYDQAVTQLKAQA